MSASLSSRRQFVPEATNETKLGGSISVLAFVAGVVLTAVAVKTDVSFLVIPGFVGIIGALLYWNTAFWMAVMKQKK